MATLWEKVQDTLDKALDATRKSAERIAKKAEETAEITKLRIEIIRLQRKISKKFAQLGAKLYEVATKKGAKKDLLKDASIKKLVEETKKLDKELSETQALLDRRRKTK